MIESRASWMQHRIDSIELKQLLQSLENTGVRVRLRGMGEKWMTFCRLVLLSDNAMILQSDDEQRTILNIRSIVELQLEEEFLDYAPNVTYEVVY